MSSSIQEDRRDSALGVENPESGCGVPFLSGSNVELCFQPREPSLDLIQLMNDQDVRFLCVDTHRTIVARDLSRYALEFRR
jgi:hypothetical protein